MKGTTTNHAKGWSSSKEGDVVYMVGLEGSPLLWVPSGKPNDEFQQVLLPIRPTESSTQQKHPELVNRKCIIFYRDTTRPHVSLITRQKLLQLDWKFWFIHCIHQTLHLQISIYFGLQNSLNRKNFNSLEGYKRYLEQFFAQKDKNFRKMELWSRLKNGRR